MQWALVLEVQPGLSLMFLCHSAGPTQTSMEDIHIKLLSLLSNMLVKVNQGLTSQSLTLVSLKVEVAEILSQPLKLPIKVTLGNEGNVSGMLHDCTQSLAHKSFLSICEGGRRFISSVLLRIVTSVQVMAGSCLLLPLGIVQFPLIHVLYSSSSQHYISISYFILGVQNCLKSTLSNPSCMYVSPPGRTFWSSSRP
jgi:hypothetical protein